MGVRTKFNLALLVVFAMGLGAAWFYLEQQFITAARSEVLQNARIMLSAANAVRGYTVREVRPLIERVETGRFEPSTVPSYAAQTNFRAVQQENREFTYKEAALNPTNPNDRATDWETDFINTFRNNGSLNELVGERETPTGRILTLARPITIRDEGCLACHSTPDRAPRTMIAQYGSQNGFGWRMNETIGAQLVSVPMELALRQATRNLHSAMVILAIVFGTAMIVLNLLLNTLVIRPVLRMSETATAVSLGNADAPEFETSGKDEIAELGRSFTRMRRSLDQAMKMLGG